MITKYQQKKSALAKELESFLNINFKRDLASATPSDVRVFFIGKDLKGKTQVHVVDCPHLGDLGIFDCGCPCRLSWSTVQSYIGQMKTIFESEGRGKFWDEELQTGNPASSKILQLYLTAVKLEQAKSHITQKQAKPLFFGKLKLLSSFLERELSRYNITVHDKFILLRDQAFFKIQFFAGDRAHDLTQCLAQEIRRLSDDSGFLVSHTVGKTFRVDRPNEFTIKRVNDTVVCPVRGLELYVSECRKLDINLSTGYLFRTLSPCRKLVLDNPITSSALGDRFKKYLKTLNLYNGETLHGIRGACAITLASSGLTESAEKIMEHVGWFSKSSYDRYSRLSKMVDNNSVATLFSKVADANPQHISTLYDMSGDKQLLPKAF